MEHAAQLELAARLAAEAAAAIMAVRRAGFAVQRKRDHSPVTAADTLAEALIVEGLRDATPDIPVVAEEAEEAGAAMQGSARFWLVDPLDGTREFAAGRDSFAVCIGLVEHGRPVLGAVALPAHGEVFAGIVGEGAWKLTEGQRRPIAARAIPAEGATVMASHHHADDPRIAAFVAARRVARVVNIGSAEKFCRVAEGTADLYPRFGTTMEWDTAAAEAVLLAAGGALADWDGAALRYGKQGWRNPGFLATGRP
jgi:3'(2'), 5'-bisphosphate nucleotidase